MAHNLRTCWPRREQLVRHPLSRRRQLVPPQVARRFEAKGSAGGVQVFDDYAHHPTEIMATLAAARERFLAAHLAIFQLHTLAAQSECSTGWATA